MSNKLRSGLQSSAIELENLAGCRLQQAAGEGTNCPTSATMLTSRFADSMRGYSPAATGRELT